MNYKTRNNNIEIMQATKVYISSKEWNYFVTLAIPPIATGLPNKVSLSYSVERHHDIGEKLVCKWLSVIYRAIYGRNWSYKMRCGLAAEFDYSCVPERTPGSYRLGYHLFIRVPAEFEEAFIQNSENAWLKVVGRDRQHPKEHWRDLPDTLTESLREAKPARTRHFDVQPIRTAEDRCRLVGYALKQVNPESLSFDRLRF